MTIHFRYGSHSLQGTHNRHHKAPAGVFRDTVRCRYNMAKFVTNIPRWGEVWGVFCGSKI